MLGFISISWRGSLKVTTLFKLGGLRFWKGVDGLFGELSDEMVNCCTRGDLGSILRVGVMTSFSLIRGVEGSFESFFGEDSFSPRVSV